jgi:hypothetical protein
MFLFLQTDAFRNTVESAKLVESKGGASRDAPSDIGPANVRRPYRGIQIKENTYSTLSVRRADGSPIPLTSSSAVPDQGGEVDAGSGKGSVNEYSDFILQTVEDNREEKQQIIETFGDPYVFFFGERPRIVTFNGLLINTEDFNWRSQFWHNYERYFRGTKLVQMNARAYIAYDTMVVEGYPLTARAVDDAQNQPYSIPFTLTMLVTNYYDYSNIGVTRFPGFGQDINLDALNHELSERRGKFISTTQEVRLKNLLASPGGGILGTLRHGIRSFNDMVSKVGGVTDAIHDVVGGRNVRVPIGIAGFLQSVGAAQVGAGAVRTLTSEGGLGSQFDAATGRFEGLNGSVTLRMPGPSKFAPSWTSKASNGPRGYIHENIDEYPVRKAPQALTQLLSEKDNFNRLVRKHERNVAASQNDAELAKWNLMAEGGGLLGDIADGVAFVKANFGTVMTAAAFVNDPLSIAKASLGIGVGTTSQSRLAGRKDELEKFGVKVSGRRSQRWPTTLQTVSARLVLHSRQVLVTSTTVLVTDHKR